MSISKTYGAQLVGLESETVIVEVDISNGLHSFSVVGLGDRSVEESKDRISAAIKNSGYDSPKQKNQKVVISLAPADMRKEGPSFDLAMAIAYLHASGNISLDTSGIIFLGELSLEGNVRKTNGVLPILCQASKKGFHTAFIPRDNIKEASLARDIDIYGIETLRELLDHISGEKCLTQVATRSDISDIHIDEKLVDMSDIRGNENAKRGLEIAGAGAHNVMLYGPPGTGKTMLAHGFRSILPNLSYEQSIEVTSIHSVARTLGSKFIVRPPFRSPHHTASYPSIVGGGGFPRPGEITLAHRGVLFLDEFPEFDQSVIEALRQPLEDKSITISRAKGTINFPAQCILIASMNPCPCGKGTDMGCECPKGSLNAYKRRLSGPIADRIDIWINVNKVDYDKLSKISSTDETSLMIMVRIEKARLIQKERFNKKDIHLYYNSEMSSKDIESCANIGDGARDLLKSSAEKLHLSARSFHKTIKVARTIADLATEGVIQEKHILEALQYRKRDGFISKS